MDKGHRLSGSQDEALRNDPTRCEEVKIGLK